MSKNVVFRFIRGRVIPMAKRAGERLVTEKREIQADLSRIKTRINRGQSIRSIMSDPLEIKRARSLHSSIKKEVELAWRTLGKRQWIYGQRPVKAKKGAWRTKKKIVESFHVFQSRFKHHQRVGEIIVAKQERQNRYIMAGSAVTTAPAITTIFDYQREQGKKEMQQKQAKRHRKLKMLPKPKSMR